MSRVLIFGGRVDVDEALAVRWLDHYLRTGLITFEIDGEAPGYDTIAKHWAISRGVPRQGYPIEQRDLDLSLHRAGNIRNARALREGKPDAAIGFPGGAGTMDMHQRLIAAGITPIRIAASTPLPLPV